MKKNKGENNKRKCHCQEVVREGLPEEVTSEQRPDLAREEPYSILVRLLQPKDEERNLRCLPWWSSG